MLLFETCDGDVVNLENTSHIFINNPELDRYHVCARFGNIAAEHEFDDVVMFADASREKCEQYLAWIKRQTGAVTMKDFHEHVEYVEKYPYPED